MYRFENYLFICVFYKISEYIEGFQIIFFLPHLKFVKNIAFFYLYLLLLIFLGRSLRNFFYYFFYFGNINLQHFCNLFD